MAIYIDYPNKGLYQDGRPRYVQKDESGRTTYCRLATPEEALLYENTQALIRCSLVVEQLILALKESR